MRAIRILIICCVLAPCVAFAQTWQWAKKTLLIDNIPTIPSKSLIDSKGNIVLLANKLGEEIVCKYDQDGNLLWKRELPYLDYNYRGLPDVCVDSFDNIYLAMADVKGLDTVKEALPGHFSLIKINTNGKYQWIRHITYTPSLIFAPKLLASGDRIIMALDMKYQTNFNYNNLQTYVSSQDYTTTSLIASLDTSGYVQWYKRIYSPGVGIACESSNASPALSINSNKELLLVGDVTGKLLVESNPVLVLPYTCKRKRYGMVLKGNGDVKWVKEIIVDTLTPRPNLLLLDQRPYSLILNNGYSIIHKYTHLDTTYTWPFSTSSEMREMTAKLYVYDEMGNLVRKDSLGRLDTGYLEIRQLFAGDGNNFYSTTVRHFLSPGNIIMAERFEITKWNSDLTVAWRKSDDMAGYFPFYSPISATYRNKSISIALQTASTTGAPPYNYFGADSVYNRNGLLHAKMVESANFIGGTAYFDLNQNGIKDNSEPAAPHLLIGNTNADTIYAATNVNGYYEIKADTGTYYLRPANLSGNFPNYSTSVPVSQTITLGGYGTYTRGKDFAIRPNSAVTDGQINITAVNIAHPGRSLLAQVVIRNTGSNNITGTYKITYDTSKLVFSGSQAPVTPTPPTLSYSFSTITPIDSIVNLLEFKVKESAVQSDTIKVTAALTASPTDALGINNSDSMFAIVRTSFDPNIKEVYPFRNLRYDSVIVGKQELDYIIHFQNTGNDTAYAVTIIDTLDAKLDLSTFRLVGSSHPVNIIWSKPNIASFYFNNILLPDSNVNELKSHGFIRFRIRPKKSVQLSDLVKNNASIYFDYNTPVITNAVTTSFITSVITGVNNNSIDVKGMIVKSNPASQHLYFSIVTASTNERMSLSLFDGSGRLILSTEKLIITNANNELNIARLSPGVYYFEVKGKRKRYVKKIIVE